MTPLPPSRYTPSGRITSPPPETLEPTPRAMYDHSLTLFGGPGGPRMPLLQVPDIADAWGRLSRALMTAPVAARYRELAIIVVAASWRSEMEWLMHAPEAAACGIATDAIEAIRVGVPAKFVEDGDGIVYRYATELERSRGVSDATYAAARSLLGDAGLVALTATIGHYTNVAMTLRAHRVPTPDGTASAFDY